MSLDAKNASDLGEILYNAYGKATQYRTPIGDALPIWSALHEDYQNGYIEAAQAVISAYGMAVAKPLDAAETVIGFDELTPAIDSAVLYGGKPEPSFDKLSDERKS